MLLKPQKLRVTALSANSPKGWLTVGSRSFAAALGRSGRRARKREGDGATPAGTWRVLYAFYRPDRFMRPRTRLMLRRITPASGWCDASGDRNYNRQVALPYPASAEKLWRDDGLYDLVVVLDHNHCPRVQGGGSAIFVHVARPGHRPTEGCIALARRDLIQLLAHLRRRDRIHIPF